MIAADFGIKIAGIEQGGRPLRMLFWPRWVSPSGMIILHLFNACPDTLCIIDVEILWSTMSSNCW